MVCTQKSDYAKMRLVSKYTFLMTHLDVMNQRYCKLRYSWTYYRKGTFANEFYSLQAAGIAKLEGTFLSTTVRQMVYFFITFYLEN